MKKVWEKPKLVVLVRGKPEEVVLLACKTEPVAGVVPSGTWGGCYGSLPVCSECADIGAT